MEMIAKIYRNDIVLEPSEIVNAKRQSVGGPGYYLGVVTLVDQLVQDLKETVVIVVLFVSVYPWNM